MHVSLINGNFSSLDALDLITQLIQVKIKFHERKIENTANEEDIKMREHRIKGLLNQLDEVKKILLKKEGQYLIESDIKLGINSVL